MRRTTADILNHLSQKGADVYIYGASSPLCWISYNLCFTKPNLAERSGRKKFVRRIKLTARLGQKQNGRQVQQILIEEERIFDTINQARTYMAKFNRKMKMWALPLTLDQWELQ